MQQAQTLTWDETEIANARAAEFLAAEEIGWHAGDEADGGVIEIGGVGGEGVVLLVLFVVDNAAEGGLDGLEGDAFALDLLGGFRAGLGDTHDGEEGAVNHRHYE